MKTKEIKPAIHFTEKSIVDFDSRMEKIGFVYEGTIDNCIWIYRKSNRLFVSVQVGFGGIMFVKINITDIYGKVVNKNVDLNNNISYTDLVRKINRIVELDYQELPDGDLPF